MMIHGVVLAAGRGTRLAPLTDHLPKPLLPVANRPVMAYGLACLQRASVTDVWSNVSYRAEQILAACHESLGVPVRLHWSVEETPLGTAGEVKRMAPSLADDLFVVIAGDAMLDVELAPLLTAHRETGALMTLATVPVDDPAQYGVVITDRHGSIQQFQEKPAPGTAVSHQANTGIYVCDPAILGMIREAGVSDFAQDVFPQLLAQGLPFYAMPVHGYWRDIGTPATYLAANLDYLAGHIRVEGYGQSFGKNLIAPSARIEPCVLTGCIVGEQAAIGADSRLRHCVVWPETHVPPGAQYSGHVLTPWGAFPATTDAEPFSRDQAA